MNDGSIGIPASISFTVIKIENFDNFNSFEAKILIDIKIKVSGIEK